jgi:hypothetical protein
MLTIALALFSFCALAQANPVTPPPPHPTRILKPHAAIPDRSISNGPRPLRTLSFPTDEEVQFFDKIHPIYEEISLAFDYQSPDSTVEGLMFAANCQRPLAAYYYFSCASHHNNLTTQAFYVSREYFQGPKIRVGEEGHFNACKKLNSTMKIFRAREGDTEFVEISGMVQSIYDHGFIPYYEGFNTTFNGQNAGFWDNLIDKDCQLIKA